MTRNRPFVLRHIVASSSRSCVMIDKIIALARKFGILFASNASLAKETYLMSKNQVVEQPIRAGVFSDFLSAKDAVARLTSQGFSTEQITVICSDDRIERHFRKYEHQDPAGKSLPEAAAVGSTIGAALGGVAAAATGAVTGNMVLALSGGAAGVCTGGVLGGFLGAMMTRGIEREAADFYDQAVKEGEVLITVSVHGEDAEAKLALAEQILTEVGAKAFPLRES